MKRFSLIAAAFCLSVGITACTAESRGYTKAALDPAETEQTSESGTKGQEESSKTDEEAASPKETGAQDDSAAVTQGQGDTDRAGAGQGETEQAAGQSQDEAGTEAEVTGIVKDAAMNTLSIQAEDGTSYQFSTMDADMQTGEEGLLLGDKVTVVYQTGGGDVLTALKVTVSTAE